MPGYCGNYFYISEILAKFFIGAKVISTYCPIKNFNGMPSFEAVMEFDNGQKLIWHEDSEGPGGFSVESCISCEK